MKHFTVRAVRGGYRVVLEPAFKEIMKHDKGVQALCAYVFDYADDAGIAAQSIFPHATYDVA